jgi:hypothetical protein
LLWRLRPCGVFEALLLARQGEADDAQPPHSPSAKIVCVWGGRRLDGDEPSTEDERAHLAPIELSPQTPEPASPGREWT